MTTWNDAVFLTDQSTDSRSEVNAYDLKGSGCGDWWVFTDPYTKCWSLQSVNSDNFVQNNVEITLNSIDGPVLRDAKFAQDFYKDRPVGSSVPSQIPVLLDLTWIGGQSGSFLPSGITFPAYKGNIVNASTIEHEWGHWASYTLWGSNFPGDGTIVEGWANFYQFAVRNYATGNYGDDLLVDYINCEEMPFGAPAYSNLQYRGIYPWGFDPVASHYPGYPDLTEYNKALSNSINYYVTSSFLWNLYDTYSDIHSGLHFKASKYDDADNDDVGESALFFSTIPRNPVSPQTNTVQQYLVDLQAQVGTVEATSMQKIYAYMFGPNGTGLNPTTKMRPAQVKSLSGYGYNIAGPYHTYLSWALQEYPSGTSYRNHQDGVNVYQSDGSGGWNYLDPSFGHSYTSSSSGADFTPYSTDPLTFKVTSYNSSLDSWNGQLVSPGYSAKIASGNPLSNQSSSFTLESANPNPFKDWFDVNFNLQSGSTINYEVLNSLGVTVISNKMSYDSPGEKHMQINSAKLPSGLYVVRLFTPDPFGQPNYQTLKVTKIQ